MDCASCTVHPIQNIKLFITLAVAYNATLTEEEILAAQEAERLEKLLDQLEEHDDVQNVYANFDIDDELMEKIRLLIERLECILYGETPKM